MFNDDDNKRDTEPSGAPLSNGPEAGRETPANPGTTDAAPQQPLTPDAEQKGKPSNPSIYYEPWQQPVYRQAPVQTTYTPGLHGGAYTAHQRPPVLEQPPEKKKRSGWPFLAKAVCLVLVCALVSAGATYGVIKLNGPSGGGTQIIVGAGSAQGAAQPGSSPAVTPGKATTLTTTGQVMGASDIYTMAVNQVVGVNSEAKTNVFGQATSSAVSGSGFVISTDGYIVTNYHVISYAVEQNYKLNIMMHDGKSYPAKITGYDQDNDLAVIKIDATGLNAATFGSNKDMKVGDQVYAIGNPLGELAYSMTSGIVSALDRAIHGEDGSSVNMFQIDAAVNPGNSGGPVYNSKGEVIGIVTAKYASTGVEGLGFAIPIDDAGNIISQLIANGHVTGKPSMGITVQDVSKSTAQYYHLVVGAYVYTVGSGSAADKAGVKVGDIITKLGNTEVKSVETLKGAMKSYKAGDSATVVVNRQGQEQTLTITFDEAGTPAAASGQGQGQGQPGFGSKSAS